LLQSAILDTTKGGFKGGVSILGVLIMRKMVLGDKPAALDSASLVKWRMGRPNLLLFTVILAHYTDLPANLSGGRAFTGLVSITTFTALRCRPAPLAEVAHT
jgi:hypothetical protein